VVVESPAKVRTLKKFLGAEFDVAATVGHVKDLPLKELGISVEEGFQPTYTVIKGKEKVVRALKKAATNVDHVFLAPDPDREGEAIAWHAAEILKKKGRTFHRVLLHELTENGVRAAMDSPQQLDKHKFESQQARRILDRLVGYQISPILWKKVQRGLSAGRVQSVAVRMVCEREQEIAAFQSVEYWSIATDLQKKEVPPLGGAGRHRFEVPDIAPYSPLPVFRIHVHDNNTGPATRHEGYVLPPIGEPLFYLVWIRQLVLVLLPLDTGPLTVGRYRYNRPPQPR